MHNDRVLMTALHWLKLPREVQHIIFEMTGLARFDSNTKQWVMKLVIPPEFVTKLTNIPKIRLHHTFTGVLEVSLHSILAPNQSMTLILIKDLQTLTYTVTKRTEAFFRVTYRRYTNFEIESIEPEPEPLLLLN